MYPVLIPAAIHSPTIGRVDCCLVSSFLFDSIARFGFTTPGTFGFIYHEILLDSSDQTGVNHMVLGTKKPDIRLK